MKFRLYTAIIILVLLVVFALQNSSQLRVRFLLWSFPVSQALLILAVGATGLLLGWLCGTRRR
jgi:uncharacterized integral membrane protein